MKVSFMLYSTLNPQISLLGAYLFFGFLYGNLFDGGGGLKSFPGSWSYSS